MKRRPDFQREPVRRCITCDFLNWVPLQGAFCCPKLGVALAIAPTEQETDGELSPEETIHLLLIGATYHSCEHWEMRGRVVDQPATKE